MVLRRLPGRSRSGDLGGVNNGSLHSHHSMDSTNTTVTDHSGHSSRRSQPKGARRGRLGRRLPKQLKRANTCTATGMIEGVFRSILPTPRGLGNQSANCVHHDTMHGPHLGPTTRKTAMEKKKNELNIFCSDIIVSTEFTLSRMAYARETTCITKLELEDLIERHDQTLFLEVRDLMIADKRPWDYIRFVDHLYEQSQERYERYLHLKHQLWRLVEDDVQKRNIPLQFQAIMELQRGSSIANAQKFLQRIHNCPELLQVEFAGALFGYLPSRIPSELKNLCCQSTNNNDKNNNNNNQRGLYLSETVVLKVSFTVPRQLNATATRFLQQNAAAVAMDASNKADMEQTSSELWENDEGSKELGDYSVSMGKARSVKVLGQCIVMLQNLEAENRMKLRQRELAVLQEEDGVAAAAKRGDTGDGGGAGPQNSDPEDPPPAKRRSSLTDLDLKKMVKKLQQQEAVDNGKPASKKHRKVDTKAAGMPELRRTKTTTSIEPSRFHTSSRFKRRSGIFVEDEMESSRQGRHASWSHKRSSFSDDDESMDQSDNSQFRRRRQGRGGSLRSSSRSDDGKVRPRRRRPLRHTSLNINRSSFAHDSDDLDRSDNFHVRRRRRQRRHSSLTISDDDDHDLDRSDNFHLRRQKRLQRRRRHASWSHKRPSLSDDDDDDEYYYYNDDHMDQSDNLHLERRRRHRNSVRRSFSDDLDQSDNFHIRRRQQQRRTLKRSLLVFEDDDEDNQLDESDNDKSHMVPRPRRRLPKRHASWSHERHRQWQARNYDDDQDVDLDEIDDDNGRFEKLGHASWSPKTFQLNGVDDVIMDESDSDEEQIKTRRNGSSSRSKKKRTSRRSRKASHRSHDADSGSSSSGERQEMQDIAETATGPTVEEDEKIVADTEVTTQKRGRRAGRRRSSLSDLEGKESERPTAPCFDWEELRRQNSKEEGKIAPPKLRRTKTMPSSFDRRGGAEAATPQQQAPLSKPDVDVAASRVKLSSMRKGLQHSLSQRRALTDHAAELSGGDNCDDESNAGPVNPKKNERVPRSMRIQRALSIEGSITRTRLHSPQRTPSDDSTPQSPKSASGTATNPPGAFPGRNGRAPRRGAAVKLRRSNTVDGSTTTQATPIRKGKKKSPRRAKSSEEPVRDPVAPWMSLVKASHSFGEKNAEASKPEPEESQELEEELKELPDDTEEPVELSSATADALNALESEMMNKSISILDLFGVDASEKEEGQGDNNGKATPDASFAIDNGEAASSSSITMENSMSSWEVSANSGVKSAAKKSSKKFHKSMSALEFSHKRTPPQRKKRTKPKRRLSGEATPTAEAANPMAGPLAPHRFCNSMATSLDYGRFCLNSDSDHSTKSNSIEHKFKDQEPDFRWESKAVALYR